MSLRFPSPPLTRRLRHTQERHKWYRVRRLGPVLSAHLCRVISLRCSQPAPFGIGRAGSDCTPKGIYTWTNHLRYFQSASRYRTDFGSTPKAGSPVGGPRLPMLVCCHRLRTRSMLNHRHRGGGCSTFRWCHLHREQCAVRC